VISRFLHKLAPLRLPDRRAALRWFTARIAPPVCVLCGGPGQVGEEIWGLDLCEYCQMACPRITVAELLPEGEALRALFVYRPPVDRLIAQLKFARDPAPARVLAMLLARELRALSPRPQCIVPLPLHPHRLRERGFNQSELIARQLGRRLALPVQTRLLERQRHTAAQSALPAAARAANIAGAFRLRPGAPVPRSVALLDDVMTTGSTLREAARVLRAAGVEHVEGWVCARALKGPETPPRDAAC
jgi:ComF family protein